MNKKMNKKIFLSIITLSVMLNGLVVFAEINEDSLKNKVIINLEDSEELEEVGYKKLFSISELGVYKKDEVDMLPLRPIAEALGFKVDWNKELKQVDISKDAFNTSLKAGENYYIIARKSPAKLSLAPENKEGTIFVPMEFFNDILKHKLMIVGNELAIIVEKAENKNEEECLRLEGYVKHINEMNGEVSILVSITDSDIKLSDVYVHIIDETTIIDKDGGKLPIDSIKIGSKVRVTTPKMMTMSLPPQTTGKEIIVEDFIKIEKREEENLKYPEIVEIENPVAKSYFDQAIIEMLEELKSNEAYKDLELDYRITYLDDEKISIIFRGTYDFLGQDKEVIKTLNMDLINGEIIDFNSYFKSDDESQEELLKVLKKASRVQYNKEFEAEGLSIYFTEDHLVVYYYELSDDVKIPTELYLDYKEIENLINKDIGKSN